MSFPPICEIICFFPEQMPIFAISFLWYPLLMKVLTLFLALFLTLLPESAPVVNHVPEQDVCVEEVCDVEEEAIIHSPRRTLKRHQTPSPSPLIPASEPVPAGALSCHSIHFCFERQWLKACLLRL